MGECKSDKFRFGSYVVPGQTSQVKRDGYVVTAKVEVDADMGPPWEEHDGHGPVSNWTDRAKRPGERVLVSDERGRQHRYYDFQKAVKMASRDGWGWLPGKLVVERDTPSLGDGTACGGRATCWEFTAYNPENFNKAISAVYKMHESTMTPEQYAARAAERDFKVLKAWCDDEWRWCGVVLSTSYNGREILENAAALWGIESNYPDSDNSYLAEVADSLLDEALEASEKERAKMLQDLGAMSRDLGAAPDAGPGAC
jgi:hypothetical protein